MPAVVRPPDPAEGIGLRHQPGDADHIEVAVATGARMINRAFLETPFEHAVR